jgi:hypothetical protein
LKIGHQPSLAASRLVWCVFFCKLCTEASSFASWVHHVQVVAGELDVANKLLEVPKEVIATMQATIIDMLPRLIYKKPGPKLFEQSLTSSKDAFDHTIDRLLQKFHAHVTM